MSDIEQLQAIADAATPGPWRHGCFPAINRRDNRVFGDGNEHPWTTVLDCKDMAFEDALHIATFDPPTVKALLNIAEIIERYLRIGSISSPELAAALEPLLDTEAR